MTACPAMETQDADSQAAGSASDVFAGLPDWVSEDPVDLER